jgi:hypothetical protein
MPEKWTKPDLNEVRLAVREALADLESVQSEILSIGDQYTTGARILRHDYWGSLAAMRKRLAEVEFLAGADDWRSTLRDALNDCRKGLEEGARTDHWLLGQYVVLRAVLGETPTVSADRQGRELWSEKAWRAAELALENLDPQEQMWAHSSIADLLMVAHGEGHHPIVAGTKHRDVVAELEAMVETGGGPAECRAIWPTFRQFWRWRYWWQHPKWQPAAEAGFDYLWFLVKPRLGLRDLDAAAATRNPGLGTGLGLGTSRLGDPGPGTPDPGPGTRA